MKTNRFPRTSNGRLSKSERKQIKQIRNLRKYRHNQDIEEG